MKHSTAVNLDTGAALFLSDRASVKNNQNKARTAVFKEIIELDHYPLTWTEERVISNTCKVSRNYVSNMAKALITYGWKPSKVIEKSKIPLKYQLLNQ
jgi:hypothetical protein